MKILDILKLFFILTLVALLVGMVLVAKAVNNIRSADLKKMSMTRKKKRGMPKLKGKLEPWMQSCLEVLKAVQSKPDSGPFLIPVDWVKFGLPDYPQIIKHPMDLGTIEAMNIPKIQYP